MRKFGWIAGLAALAIGAIGCTQENPNLEKKIDALGQRLASIEQKLATGAGARGGAAQQQQQRPKRPEPDKESVFAVPIAGLPFHGNATAPVTIVQGYEYACPACSMARQTVAQTLEKYGDKVKIVYKPYIVHPDIATDASLAVCAAHQQGKFDKMDPLLWDKAFGARNFKAENIEAIATEAGLDMKRYAKDVATCKEQVVRHQTELAGFGQGATPTFFVNGRYIVGARPEPLHALIDQELAKADERIKSGTKVADYYKTWVLDKGLKKFEPPRTGS
jgi:protein-disulfide isomerase